MSSVQHFHWCPKSIQSDSHSVFCFVPTFPPTWNWWMCTQSDKTQRRICQITSRSWPIMILASSTLHRSSTIFVWNLFGIFKTNKNFKTRIQISAICEMHVGTHQNVERVWFFVASGRLHRYFFYFAETRPSKTHISRRWLLNVCV